MAADAGPAKGISVETRRRPALLVAAPCALVWLAAGSASRCENLEQRWYFGGAAAFHATQDSARSNADAAGDPRPDDFISREAEVDDAPSLHLLIGYGLTRRLSLQLDVGYFRGDVGPVDFYLSDSFSVATNPSQATNLNFIKSRQTSLPMSAGTLVEVPVTVTGVLRFRTDRVLNPFLGVGAGMLFTNLTGGDVDGLNGRLGDLRIRGVRDIEGKEITPRPYLSLKNEGRVPLTFPVTARVGDSFEWHLDGGVEYFFGDRLSLVAQARYSFVNEDVVVELAGEEQVTFSIFSEKLFRPDGSLRLFSNTGVVPNPLVDPANQSLGRVKCALGTTGDFDSDGRSGDLCYRNDTSTSADEPVGILLVQGGRINLSGYTVQVGLRFHF